MGVRRMRTDVPLAERILNWAFGAFGGYGRFVAQPLILLVAIWFAAVCWTHAYLQTQPEPAGYAETARFMAHIFIAPPTLWLGDQRVADFPEWAKRIHDSSPGTLELLSLGGFLITLSLIAVFLVSLRRRFALHRG